MSQKAPLVRRSPTLRLARAAWEKISSGVSFVGNPGWQNVIRLDGAANPNAEELSKPIALATSAYAYTAIMYRASKLAEPPLAVSEETDEGDRLLRDHPRGPLLEEPSLDYGMGELLQLTEVYQLVTGAAIWALEENLSGELGRIVPFSADEFDTAAEGDRIYGRFFLKQQRSRQWRPEEVVHFREINPRSWRKPLSKLDVALSMLDLGHQVNRTVRNYMRQAVFPGGVVSTDPDWHPDEDEWEAFKNTVNAWQAGPINAGVPLVVPGGTTFSRAALGLNELLPDDVLDRLEAVVGSVFGIPPVVLGWKVGLENSPWSQMGEARQMTYEDTIEPRWREYERKISPRLLPEEERMAGRSIRFDTSQVRAFQQDDLTRARVVNLLKDDWTRDERRVYTGQDPLPEEDPRGTEIGSAVARAVAGGVLGDELDDGAGADEEDAAVADLLFQKKGDLSKADRTWLGFEVATKASEPRWVRGIAPALEELGKRTLRIADEILRSPKGGAEELEEKAVDPDSVIAFLLAYRNFLKDEGEEILQDAALPLVESTGAQAVRVVGADLGLSFSVLQPGLALFVAEEAEFLASVMGESTGRMVAKVVQGQLESGGLIRDIRKELEGAYAFSRERAQLVARTETTRAWNGAQRRALSKWQEEQSEEVRVLKQWLSSRDRRVRPEHDALDDGKLYQIDELFPNGLQKPGEPNCRCTLLYELERPE